LGSPTVLWTDTEIRYYAWDTHGKFGVTLVYVELSGALTEKTPNIAIVNFDKIGIPVERVLSKKLGSYGA